jgi:hypothetical protein
MMDANDTTASLFRAGDKVRILKYYFSNYFKKRDMNYHFMEMVEVRHGLSEFCLLIPSSHQYDFRKKRISSKPASSTVIPP